MIGNFAFLGGWSAASAALGGSRDGQPKAAGLQRTLARLARAASAAYRLRQARRQLHALDDHLLSDAGIGRHEIDAVIDDLGRRWR